MNEEDYDFPLAGVTEEQINEVLAAMYGQEPTLRESLGLNEDDQIPVAVLQGLTNDLFVHLLELATNYTEISEGVAEDGTSMMVSRLAIGLDLPLTTTSLRVLQGFEDLVQVIIDAENEERALAGADVPLLNDRGEEVV